MCLAWREPAGRESNRRCAFPLPGLGHYDVTSVPTKLGGDLAGVKVVQVATYGDCCLAVSADGGLFGWGNSEYLQLASVTESTQVRAGRRGTQACGGLGSGCGGLGSGLGGQGCCQGFRSPFPEGLKQAVESL